jgi:hypothetical protein
MHVRRYRGVRVLGIEVFEGKKSCYLESRSMISRQDQDHPSGRTRGSHRRYREKSRQGVNPSVFGVHRDIGDLSDKWFVHLEIAIRETPISGGQLSAQQG